MSKTLDRVAIFFAIIVGYTTSSAVGFALKQLGDVGYTVFVASATHLVCLDKCLLVDLSTYRKRLSPFSLSPLFLAKWHMCVQTNWFKPLMLWHITAYSNRSNPILSGLNIY